MHNQSPKSWASSRAVYTKNNTKFISPSMLIMIINKHSKNNTSYIIERP